MSIIKDLKNILNINGINVIQSSDGQNLGPLVIAHEGNIPVVKYGSLLSFGNITIKGNVLIEEAASIRRECTIIGTPANPAELAPYSLLMDYTLFASSKLGESAGIAHAGKSTYSDWGDNSLANIRVTTAGAKDNRTEIQTKSYLDPGVEVPSGASARSNVLYSGGRVRALSNAYVDKKTFEVDGNRKAFSRKTDKPVHKYHYQKAVYLTENELDNDDYAVKKVHTVNRLFALPFFKESPNGRNFTDLKDIGVDEWIKQEQQAERNHNPTFSNWLQYYIPVMQVLKQYEYILEDAKAHGSIVWHSAAIQSEVLHLQQAKKVIEKFDERLAEDTGSLIKAKLYLLGLHEPKSYEFFALDSAFKNAPEILSAVAEKISSIKQPVTITQYNDVTVDKVFSTSTIKGNARIELQFDEARLGKLSEYLHYAAGIAREFKLDNLKSNETTNFSIISDNKEVSDVRQWRKSLNPEGIDITKISDGPQVRRFRGYTPVISNGAVLVSNVDIAGPVEIGKGAVFKSGSIRNEQSTVPVYVDNSYLENTITHTALKEQFPVYVGSTNAKDGKVVAVKSVIHGAHIQPHSYLAENTIIGDEATVKGVHAPNSLNPGQRLADRSGELSYYAGNYCKNIFAEKENGALKSPRFHARFKAWWDSASPFSDIRLDEKGADEPKVKEKINEIYDEKKHSAKKELDSYVEKYGAIYRLSALYQADVNNLKNVVDILNTSELKTQHKEVVQKVEHLIDGIDYLLGRKTQISRPAALQLTNAANGKGVINEVAKLFEQLADSGKTISTSNWPEKNSPYTFTYDDAKTLVEKGVKEVSALDKRNYEVANQRDKWGHDHVIKADKLIENGLFKTVDFYPEHLRLIASELERAQVHIKAARVANLKHQQLSPQHDSAFRG